MHATAMRLMRLVLPLLDRAGQGSTAARLQHAIDTAQDLPDGPPTADVPPRLSMPAEPTVANGA